MSTSFIYGSNADESGIPLNGKTVTVHYGEDIDSLEVGGVRYGGSNGKKSDEIKIPSDGAVTIWEMQTHANRYLGYLKIEVSGKIWELGTKKEREVFLTFQKGLTATIIDFYYSTSRVTGFKFSSDFSTDRLFIGGRGGSFSPVENVGGKDFVVFAGEDVDALQIDNIKYGGGGGYEKARATIPQNGQIKLLEIQTHSVKYLGYLKVDVGGTIIECGQKKEGECVFSIEDNGSLPVKLSSINHGSRIDGIEFTLV